MPTAAEGQARYPGRIRWFTSLQFLISVVGADRVMLGTDWPHQVHDIRGGNALKVFGF